MYRNITVFFKFTVLWGGNQTGLNCRGTAAGRSGSNSSRKPKAARKSDRLALIGAEKWQGIIRRNGQSAAILSTQSLTCGSRQVTFISLNGYYYAVLACSVDFALSRVGCKCWRIRACLVCYHTSPGHRCGRVWITTLSWELFG